MNIGHWILDGKTPKQVSLVVWAEWLENMERRIVARSYYQRHGKRIFASTVFIGLDHRFFGNGPPLLFETMVFDAEIKRGTFLDGREFTYREEIIMDRWSFYDEALEGHEMLFNRAKVEYLGVKPKG